MRKFSESVVKMVALLFSTIALRGTTGRNGVHSFTCSLRMATTRKAKLNNNEYSTTSLAAANIKHVVMFNVLDEASDEKVQAMKEGLLGLPGKLNPLFLSHELGFDLKLEGGQNHPAGKNRSVIWSAIFDNVNDYEAYDTSDEHISVVQDFIKPIIVPGSRSAIQYDIDE